MAIMVKKAKKSQVRDEAYEYFIVRGDDFEATYPHFTEAMAIYRKCEDGKLYGVTPDGEEHYLLAL